MPLNIDPYKYANTDSPDFDQRLLANRMEAKLNDHLAWRNPLITNSNAIYSPAPIKRGNGTIRIALALLASFGALVLTLAYVMGWM